MIKLTQQLLNPTGQLNQNCTQLNITFSYIYIYIYIQKNKCKTQTSRRKKINKATDRLGEVSMRGLAKSVLRKASLWRSFSFKTVLLLFSFNKSRTSMIWCSCRKYTKYALREALHSNWRLDQINLQPRQLADWTMRRLVNSPKCFDRKFWENNRSKSHSAWSESSAACPRPRGGHRKGEKVGTWAFATLQRRGPEGRAHILVVFSCKGIQRGKWRGPKGQADALAVVVLWRKEDRATSRRARFWWRLIKNAKF